MGAVFTSRHGVEATVTGGGPLGGWRVWIGDELAGTFETLNQAWDAAKGAARLAASIEHLNGGQRP